MGRYRVVNSDRFVRFVKMVALILLIVIVALFVKFMNSHNGLQARTVEYHTYEIVQQTSPYNNRIKVPVAREVIYRYVYE